MNAGKQWFMRSGIASLDDFETENWKNTFSVLENLQKTFLSKENHFRSDNYQWPRDALHEWSRIWEYPYVFSNLKAWSIQAKTPNNMKVLDFGSGVTFFPFALSASKFDITATDIDPVAKRDFCKAMQVLRPSPGILDFVLATENGIDLPDAAFEAVYSISVLEHVSNFEKTIREVARVLIPKGLFVLTIDLGLLEELDISYQAYLGLRRILGQYFDLLYPETTTHPLRQLYNANSPLLTFKNTETKVSPFFKYKKRIREFLIPSSVPQNRLACAGFVLTLK